MLNTFQSTLLILFGVVAYMMWVDENVGIYLTLVIKIAKVNVERYWWMIRFHPQNPITNLTMKWKYEKLAREIEQELKSRNNRSK